ncbi:efflux RND transporter periplasmic adaptor subunit [Patescibacteria group bacterium]|nr:efflux RND transporter periplasmic adaptor subunit [Patescibacteria group bacterium]
MAYLSRTMLWLQKRWHVFLAILIVLFAAWYYFFGRTASFGPTITVTPADFPEQVAVSGTVTAAKDVALGFAANGRISNTYARVGQHVEAGTVLAETENGDLAAALNQAEANLASLQTGSRPEQVAVAEAAVGSAQTALVSALQSAYTVSDDAVHNKIDAFFSNPRSNPKLTFTVANANLELTVESDRQAIEPVFASWAARIAKVTPATAADSVSASQSYLKQVMALLTDANAALNQSSPDQTTSASVLAAYTASIGVARANVNSAISALTAATSALDSAQKNLTLTEAGPTADAVAAQQAAVQAAQAALAKTRITAPFSGTVTRMDAKVGEIVSPTTSDISMQSDGVFQIETYIPEISIANIAPQDAATVTLDAYGPSVSFPAKVIMVDPAETMQNGVPTYKTTLSFLTPDARMRSGMTANVLITTAILPNAVVIPSGAVNTYQGKSYVSVVRGRVVVNTAVTLGPSPSLGEVQILSGLSSGDMLLLTPLPQNGVAR